MAIDDATPREEYYGPILRVLDELGGSGNVSEVLERLEKAMKDTFTEADYEPVELRWQNNARWARNDLVRDGLLKQGSRRGVWEITQDGRRLLANWIVGGQT